MITLTVVFVMQVVMLALYVASMIATGVFLYRSDRRMVREAAEHERRMAAIPRTLFVPGNGPRRPS